VTRLTRLTTLETPLTPLPLVQTRQTGALSSSTQQGASIDTRGSVPESVEQELQ
jgi:hypothetical protein